MAHLPPPPPLLSMNFYPNTIRVKKQREGQQMDSHGFKSNVQSIIRQKYHKKRNRKELCIPRQEFDYYKVIIYKFLLWEKLNVLCMRLCSAL